MNLSCIYTQYIHVVLLLLYSNNIINILFLCCTDLPHCFIELRLINNIKLSSSLHGRGLNLYHQNSTTGVCMQYSMCIDQLNIVVMIIILPSKAWHEKQFTLQDPYQDGISSMQPISIYIYVIPNNYDSKNLSVGTNKGVTFSIHFLICTGSTLFTLVARRMRLGLAHCASAKLCAFMIIYCAHVV